MPDLNDLTRCQSKRKQTPGIFAKGLSCPILHSLHGLVTIFVLFTAIVTSAANMGFANTGSTWKNDVLHTEVVNRHFNITVNKLHHVVLMTGGDSNDCYTFKEMLQQPDKADFIQAMVKEVQDHE